MRPLLGANGANVETPAISTQIDDYGGEEMLVPDDRSAMGPAQMVEDKLSEVLKGASVVSQLRLKTLNSHRA